MNELELYLILKLNAIIWIFALTTAFFVIYSTAILIGHFITRELNETRSGERIVNSFIRWEKKARWAWATIPLAIIFFIATLSIPTTKQYVIMKVIPKIVNNEKVQDLPDNLLDFVNGWLKENTKK